MLEVWNCKVWYENMQEFPFILWMNVINDDLCQMIMCFSTFSCAENFKIYELH